jgi:hypothetical protein
VALWAPRCCPPPPPRIISSLSSFFPHRTSSCSCAGPIARRCSRTPLMGTSARAPCSADEPLKKRAMGTASCPCSPALRLRHRGHGGGRARRHHARPCRKQSWSLLTVSGCCGSEHCRPSRRAGAARRDSAQVLSNSSSPSHASGHHLLPTATAMASNAGRRCSKGAAMVGRPCYQVRHRSSLLRRSSGAAQGISHACCYQ